MHLRLTPPSTTFPACKMRLPLTIFALLTSNAAAEVFAANVYTGSASCGGTPTSATVSLGCTTLGATSASFTLVTGSSPAAYTYSLFYASPTCSGAPDVTFMAVPANGASCVSNAVGNANVPANSASMIVFSVPSTFYAVTGYEAPGCTFGNVEPRTLSLSLGCSNVEGTVLTSTVSSSLIPIPNTSPLLFNYSEFTALACAAGSLELSWLLASDSFTCSVNSIGPEPFFGPGAFSARLFPIPSLEFEVTFFGLASCAGERGSAARYNLGCFGPFGIGSYLSLAPVPAPAPYATPIAYNVSLYQGTRGRCRRTEVMTRFTALTDGSCVPTSLSTTHDQGSLRLVIFPTPAPPSPPPAPGNEQALTAGAIAAIVLGVVLACCIAGAAYAFLRGIILLSATQKSAPASTTYVTTVPSWLQPTKDVKEGGTPPTAPPAFALVPPPSLPNSV